MGLLWMVLVVLAVAAATIVGILVALWVHAVFLDNPDNLGHEEIGCFPIICGFVAFLFCAAKFLVAVTEFWRSLLN